MGGRRSSLLPFVTAISVASMVVVGIIGLRQGHYCKGRIAKRPRELTVIIALSVATLASAFIGKENLDAKDEQDSSSRLSTGPTIWQIVHVLARNGRVSPYRDRFELICSICESCHCGTQDR